MSHQCSQCGKQYVYRGSFVNHCISHCVSHITQMKDENNIQQASPSILNHLSDLNSSKRNKRLRCDFDDCPMTYIQPSALAKHRTIHINSGLIKSEPEDSEPLGILPVIPEHMFTESVIPGLIGTDPGNNGQIDTEPEIPELIGTEPKIPEPMSTVPEISGPISSTLEIPELIDTEPEILEPTGTEQEISGPISTESTNSLPENTEPTSEKTESNAEFEVPIKDDDDAHNETISPMDTTFIAESVASLSKDKDGSVLVVQNEDQENMKTDVQKPKNLICLKSIGMESTKQQAKLEKMAKWILLLVRQCDGTVDLEKVEADFKEFEHLISELNDNDEELVDHWLIRKTLIWNEISKFKCKVRDSRIDKKLDWMANRLEQRLNEHDLSHGDWTELKCQFEAFAQMVTELERSGELGMKWDAQYNRIRVEIQKRS